jgi:hypothetical protein
MAPPLVIDDRHAPGLASNLGTSWRLIADTVMGGESGGRLDPGHVEGRSCLCLAGRVSLAHGGGFLQAGLDLAPAGTLDARAYAGIELAVRGNGEDYNVHLRTRDTRVVWQSYRSSFRAGPEWCSVRLPFSGFQPYRIEGPLDTAHLRRLGLVAIGRAMAVELCVARVVLYV